MLLHIARFYFVQTISFFFHRFTGDPLHVEVILKAFLSHQNIRGGTIANHASCLLWFLSLTTLNDEIL